MSGYRITEWNGSKVLTLATKANVGAMHKAALVVESDVKTHFAKAGTGHRYGKHVASRPGRPPAIDTGILRASMMSDVQKQGLGIIGRVGPDIEYIAAKSPGPGVEYGFYLEVGTKNMQPRPFLRPALVRCRKKVIRIFKNANGD